LKEGALGPKSQLATALPLKANGKVYDINIYVAASAANGAAPQAFFFLLDCYELFGCKTRGEIYTFKSERAQLTFFSVLNRAVAFVLRSYGAQCVQLHDYHAALCLQ